MEYFLFFKNNKPSLKTIALSLIPQYHSSSKDHSSWVYYKHDFLLLESVQDFGSDFPWHWANRNNKKHSAPNRISG